jgi:hypothetical protein
VLLHKFLASAVSGIEWLTSRFGRFTPGKELRCPLDSKLGGPQSRSGRFGVEKNSIAFARIRKPDRPARSTVAVLPPTNRYGHQITVNTTASHFQFPQTFLEHIIGYFN